MTQENRPPGPSLLHTVRGLLVAVTLLFPTCPFQLAQDASPHPKKSHYRAREHLSEYHGPEADELAPSEVDEVRIGYFGPDNPDHPIGGDLWVASTMAIQEENQAGGYRGVPFAVVPRWSENPWGTGIAAVPRLVYEQEVWAILGSIDGASTHLVEQVAAKARIPILNPGSSDKTINLANVPWMFSCLPGEHLQVSPLIQVLKQNLGDGQLIMVSGTDHDSRVFSHEFSQSLAAEGIALAFHYQLEPGQAREFSFFGKIVESSSCLVLAASAQDSAPFVRELRERGYAESILGTSLFGRRFFVEEAGASADGVLFPLIGRIDQQDEFSARFRERTGHDADFAARQAYDAVRLLAHAIRRAGLSRTEIRDALRDSAPWQGIAGVVDWDPLGHNQRAVTIGTIKDGRIVPVPPTN
jgi:branched-chain amino acid transport system substrate-binding protein